MRIVMVGPFGFHPNKTMRSRAFQLAKALVNRNHQLKIIMPPWQTPEEADTRWQENGVEIDYVSLKGGILGITRRMTQAALQWKPDVVHCFKPKAYSGLVAWNLWQFRRRNLRLITDTDDWEGWGGWNDLAPYSRPQKHVFAWQEEWGMRHCHALTVASRELEMMAQERDVPAERIVYLPNGAGIEPENGSKPPHRPPTILLYSRLFEFDTERLVAVLKGVKTAVSNLHILAIGAGLYADEAAQFRQQLEEAGLEESIEDAGWVETERLPALMRQADVGVYLMDDTLLNRTKCPVKLADMTAVGLPIVAEEVGQVSEYIVQNKTGLLRPSGDSAGLTRDLIYLLQNREVSVQMGKAAAVHYEAEFDWGKTAVLLESVYKNSV